MQRSHPRPALTEEQARRVLFEQFGLSATRAHELPAERDQNFRVDLEDGTRAVLKISNPAEDVAIVQAQRDALRHLAARGVATVPQVRETRDGSTEAWVDADHGKSLVRLIGWIEGTPLAEVQPKSMSLLRELGATLGAIDRALADFDHPAIHRAFPWSPSEQPHAIEHRLHEITDEAARAGIAAQIASISADIAPRLDALPTQAIHNDANDWNVIVRTPFASDSAVAGLIDFGDLVHSYRVAEPATAAAYAAMGRGDPLSAVAALVAGYHGANPLVEAEADVLWEFVRMRLCLSVTMAAVHRREEPGVPYHAISEAAAWALLYQMNEIHPRLARYAIRAACGFEPCAHSKEVRAWIEAHRQDFSPVLPIDPATARLSIVDLSVGAPPLVDDMTDADAATRAVFRSMEDQGAELGVGRYDEVRVCYDGDLFSSAVPAPAEGDFAERRTVHLGVDLFIAAGTPIFAPCDGVVVGLRDNDIRLDYGPTVILRHSPKDAPEFETLYGHLDAACLDLLRLGQEIGAGDPFAAVGDAPRNGDWPPHVHMQVIVDRLDRDGEFPGVAAPRQRDLWRSLSPSPLAIARLPEIARAPQDPGAAPTIEARRRLGPSLSLSYRHPLKIVRGRGARLYDHRGQAYLDAVNNVCHVGHSHPRVVRAVAQQAAVLNTNTRYLHDLIGAYSERLLATLPAPLEVLYLVCSGSEANELALRIARGATGRHSLICQDAAYHGNSQALIDVSPYKHNRRGGSGTPPHVRVAPLPDPYRGVHRVRDCSSAVAVGGRYAEDVERIIRKMHEDGAPPAALIAEALPGCGGQIAPPPGYLARVFDAIREGGGLAIADEVQTGMGRVGSHFWAFEAQHAMPDIVTIGKPIGNGHPLAAVATTRAIADRFANGMEYFNTFGGNPVSCAAGLAVLDVIEEEGLQAHARQVGDRLRDALKELMARHTWIGDVRGMGLFLGVEFVVDPKTRKPAREVARHAVERMRARGILLSTDGPDDNVIKIKPPLPFSEEDADRLVSELDAVLCESAFRR